MNFGVEVDNKETDPIFLSEEDAIFTLFTHLIHALAQCAR